MTSSSVESVLSWLAAVNAGDAAGAVALSAEGIAIIGPRGSARGHDVLRAWVENAGASFTTLSVYARGNVVVVEQHGIWRDRESGKVRGEADVATRFRVARDGVVELERFDSVEAALEDTGVTLADKVQ